ncbi:MAG: hypothetical protein ACE5JK_03950 [Candidatus Omnitrophota bacterium]
MENLASKGLIKTAYNIRHLSYEDGRYMARRFDLGNKLKKDPENIFINRIISQGNAEHMGFALALKKGDIGLHSFKPGDFFPFITPDGEFVTSDHVAYMPQSERKNKEFKIAGLTPVVCNINEHSLAYLILNNLLCENFKGSAATPYTFSYPDREYKRYMSEFRFTEHVDPMKPALAAAFLYSSGYKDKADALLQKLHLTDKGEREVMGWIMASLFAKVKDIDMRPFVFEWLKGKDRDFVLKVMKEAEYHAYPNLHMMDLLKASLSLGFLLILVGVIFGLSYFSLKAFGGDTIHDLILAAWPSLVCVSLVIGDLVKDVKKIYGFFGVIRFKARNYPFLRQLELSQKAKKPAAGAEEGEEVWKNDNSKGSRPTAGGFGMLILATVVGFSISPWLGIFVVILAAYVMINNMPKVKSLLAKLFLPKDYMISPDADWTTVFTDNSKPIVVEVGFGSGKELTEMAQANPQFNYVGIERREAAIDRLNHRLVTDELSLPNLRIIYGVDYSVFRKQKKKGIVSEVYYIVMSDDPSALMHDHEAIRSVLKDGGRLYVSHDGRLDHVKGEFEESGFKDVTGKFPFPHRSDDCSSWWIDEFIVEKPAAGAERAGKEEGNIPKEYIVKAGDSIVIGEVVARLTAIKPWISVHTGQECYKCIFNISAPLDMHIVREEIDDGRIRHSGVSGKGSVEIYRFTDSPESSAFKIGDIRIAVLPKSAAEGIAVEITNPSTSVVRIKSSEESESATRRGLQQCILSSDERRKELGAIFEQAQARDSKIREAVEKIKIDGRGLPLTHSYQQIMTELKRFLPALINPDSEYGKTILSKLKTLRIASGERHYRFYKYFGFIFGVLLLATTAVLTPHLTLKAVIVLAAFNALIAAMSIELVGINAHRNLEKFKASGQIFGKEPYDGLFLHLLTFPPAPLILLSGGWTPSTLAHEFGHYIASVLELNDKSYCFGYVFKILSNIKDFAFSRSKYAYKEDVESLRRLPTEKARERIVETIIKKEKEHKPHQNIHKTEENYDLAIYLVYIAKEVFGYEDKEALEFIVSLFKQKQAKEEDAWRARHPWLALFLYPGTKMTYWHYLFVVGALNALANAVYFLFFRGKPTPAAEGTESVESGPIIHKSFSHSDLYHWLKSEIEAGRLEKGLPLMLFDYHHDADRGSSKINIATWLYHAQDEGLIGEVYWVKPKWSSLEDKAQQEEINKRLAEMLGFKVVVNDVEDLPKIEGPVIVSIDFDYFSYKDPFNSIYHRPSFQEIRGEVSKIVNYLSKNKTNVKVADFTKTGLPLVFSEHPEFLMKVLTDEFKTALDTRDEKSTPTPGIEGKDLPDGSPLEIYKLLKTKFKGKWVTPEKIHKINGLSVEHTIKYDLGDLVFLGLVERKARKKGKKKEIIYRAADLSPPKWKIVEPILKGLGRRPTKDQKGAARRKILPHIKPHIKDTIKNAVFTPDEKKVLSLLLDQKLSFRESAKVMGISPWQAFRLKRSALGELKAALRERNEKRALTQQRREALYRILCKTEKKLTTSTLTQKLRKIKKYSSANKYLVRHDVRADERLSSHPNFLLKEGGRIKPCAHAKINF